MGLARCAPSSSLADACSSIPLFSAHEMPPRIAAAADRVTSRIRPRPAPVKAGGLGRDSLPPRLHRSRVSTFSSQAGWEADQARAMIPLLPQRVIQICRGRGGSRCGRIHGICSGWLRWRLLRGQRRAPSYFAEDTPPLKLVKTIELEGYPQRRAGRFRGSTGQESDDDANGGRSNHFDHLTPDLKNNRLLVVPEDNKSIEVYDIRSGKFVHSIKGIGVGHSVVYRGRHRQNFCDGRL